MCCTTDTTVKDIPSFLLVVDDDTFVNVDNVARVLAGRDPDTKL